MGRRSPRRSAPGQSGRPIGRAPDDDHPTVVERRRRLPRSWFEHRADRPEGARRRVEQVGVGHGRCREIGRPAARHEDAPIWQERQAPWVRVTVTVRGVRIVAPSHRTGRRESRGCRVEDRGLAGHADDEHSPVCQGDRGVPVVVRDRRHVPTGRVEELCSRWVAAGLEEDPAVRQSDHRRDPVAEGGRPTHNAAGCRIRWSPTTRSDRCTGRGHRRGAPQRAERRVRCSAPGQGSRTAV